MSRIAELLAAKRVAQIKRMNGEENVDDKAVDEELAKLTKMKPTRKKGEPNRSLKISGHARKRMSQRGMGANVVYAIWRVAEERKQSDGRRVYVLTRKSIEAATYRDAQLLEPWCRCAIVIVDLPSGPMLVTVLAAGEDTRVISTDFHRRRRREN